MQSYTVRLSKDAYNAVVLFQPPPPSTRPPVTGYKIFHNITGSVMVIIPQVTTVMENAGIQITTLEQTFPINNINIIISVIIASTRMFISALLCLLASIIISRKMTGRNTESCCDVVSLCYIFTKMYILLKYIA